MNAKKVLIVDDQADMIEVIQELLELDYEEAIIHSAVDVSNALKLTHENEYSLICTDLNMPVMNGIEFIKEVRSGSTCNKDVHFIIITGDIDEVAVDLSLLKNVQIVNKTDNIPKLLEMIGSYIAS